MDLQRISVFERIKRTTEDGFEYWQSREFAKALEYDDNRNFDAVITKAKTACVNSQQPVDDHFGDSTEMVDLGSGAKREIGITLLSRYACYLIIQNADPDKEVVALGQTYFAIQTRRQELSDLATEDGRRVILRREMKSHNVRLAEAASACGIIEPVDYAIFQDHGYRGLYSGLSARDLHSRRGLKKSQKILDHMGSTELAANLFRATQTEEKLRREKPRGKDGANHIHGQVGSKVRQTIRELGGTMPEELPAVESIKAVERRLAKSEATPPPQLPEPPSDPEKAGA